MSAYMINLTSTYDVVDAAVKLGVNKTDAWVTNHSMPQWQGQAHGLLCAKRYSWCEVPG